MKSDSLPAPAWLPLDAAIENAYQHAMLAIGQTVPEDDVDFVLRALASRILSTNKLRVTGSRPGWPKP